MTLATILLAISIILCTLYLTVISKFCEGKATQLFGLHGAHVFRMVSFFGILFFTWASIIYWWLSLKEV